MGVMKGMTEVCQYLSRGGLGGVVEECALEIRKNISPSIVSACRHLF